jgi:hypothetical protein
MFGGACFASGIGWSIDRDQVLSLKVFEAFSYDQQPEAAIRGGVLYVVRRLVLL